MKTKALGRVMVGALICVTIMAALTTSVSTADASEIVGFTTQTTKTVQTPHEPGASEYEFMNEPYKFTEAGGHPYALTSNIEFASEEINGRSIPSQDLKDMVIDLPTGLLANPLAVQRCRLAQAISGGRCPIDSQVGVFVLHLSSGVLAGPIVDLTPAAGQSAELGLQTPLHSTFLLPGRLVRTSQGYGLALVANGLPELGILSIQTTLWGIPASSTHDPQRNLSCLGGSTAHLACEGGNIASGEEPLPFLTMPSDCSAGVEMTTVWTDSWEQPGRYTRSQSSLPPMTGCNLLPFDPELEVRPDTELADEPLGVDLSIRANEDENPQGVAAPPLHEISVTLPQGISISPSIADGIQACQQTGPEGIDFPNGLAIGGEPLQPGEVGEGEEIDTNGEPRLAPGHCPEASTIGTVEALTPLLANPIKGRAYLAAPGCGALYQPPCGEVDVADGNLYRIYVELGERFRNEGINIKLEGDIHANPVTGQLTVKLLDSPQLPLSELNIELDGGPRALLDSAPTCGEAQTTSDLAPWSAPGTTPEGLFVPGTPDANPSSFYSVTGCTGTPNLHPRMLAGTLTSRPGTFSTFSFTVIREDREPYLSQMQLHAPRGLSAVLSSVLRCEGTSAAVDSCPESSLIGTALIAAGSGPHPYEIPGHIYLTNGYDGSPLGLSIVINGIAGPFNFGHITIHARVDIDPQTAALTITSDPLPQIVMGVPLRLQRITLNIDRANLLLNPTNCGAQQITATIVGTQNTLASLSNPFAVGGCKNLSFKPTLKASTTGRASYANGASLDVKLAFPHTSPGSEANLAQIKLTIPKQLPSRLTTLQSSCASKTFEADPAACPKSSIVGIARVRTPILAEDLIGPVYIISQGHRSFPAPIIVLQNDGLDLDLAGSTAINKAHVASVAFDAVPDIPIDSLELYLPQGPHSLLGASTSLCAPRTRGKTPASKTPTAKRMPISLVMPTELTAQNGAIVHRNTKIEVTGCPNNVRP